MKEKGQEERKATKKAEGKKGENGEEMDQLGGVLEVTGVPLTKLGEGGDRGSSNGGSEEGRHDGWWLASGILYSFFVTHPPSIITPFFANFCEESVYPKYMTYLLFLVFQLTSYSVVKISNKGGGGFVEEVS